MTFDTPLYGLTSVEIRILEEGGKTTGLIVLKSGADFSTRFIMLDIAA